MAKRTRYRLSDAEKDALLDDQAALIEAQAVRIRELEAALSAPKKTSRNSHTPPSAGHKPNNSGGKSGRKKPRPPRPGVSRRLAEDPDTVVQQRATSCGGCGSDVSGQRQSVRHRYDHVDLPPIRPLTTRIELLGGRCGCCGARYRAEPPAGMAPGTPFGSNIQALLLYLHHSHHVGFERLARLMDELFGLKISQGAIANAFRRLADPLERTATAIRAALRDARVIASDETTTRIDGVTHWQWVFVSDTAVLHEIAPRRAKAVAEKVLGDHRPEVWISDRYGGQQDLAGAHQVCLAHVLRDVQYAIDCGDTVVAPKIRDLLRWTIRVGRRRDQLKDTTLAQYHAKAERKLDALLGTSAAHPAGRVLQAQIKAWRTKFFVFLADRRVPATNNVSEREIRPSVVFRKVTNGFRSEWGAGVHAGYRSLTSTARLHAHTAIDAVRALVSGNSISGMDRFLPTT